MPIWYGAFFMPSSRHFARMEPEIFSGSFFVPSRRKRYVLRFEGKWIQDLRKQKGLTQEELADRLNISTSNMSKIEIGYSGVSIDLLIEMAFFFKVSFEYILLGDEPDVLFGRQEKENNVKAQMKLLIEQLYELGNEL